MRRKAKIPEEILIEKSDIVYELYIEFRRQLKIKKEDDTFTFENCQKLIQFISYKDNIHSVGRRYLWNYITFVFSKKKQNAGWKFSWLHTRASLNDWFDKDLDWYYYHNFFLKEKKLVYPQIKHEADLLEQEDVYRKKYFNRAKGLITCLENTSLFDPESKWCVKCFNRLDCKKILKENNSKLYEQRINRTK